MELTAAIRGLAALKEPCQVQLISDSEYLVNAIEKGWARRWQANGWHRQNKKMAENRDLWEDILKLCDKHQVRFEWIRGHTGHPEKERCDQLAVLAAQSLELHEDTGYEDSSPSSP
jgi:ribonuclease HI